MNIIKKYIIRVFNRLQNLSQQQKYLEFRSKYTIHKTFKFNGIGIEMYGNGKITIGENTYIGQFTFLQSSENYKINIGENCAISHNVKVYTNSYDSNQNFNETTKKTHQGNVIIGNGVWIGVNVVIIPGVTIGDNVIIGANSVVTKDIPKNTIVGGVPAKVIRMKDDK